ncbi:MAG: hypothetical protein CMA06_00235 [Euryarchaeota archaeon]|nr:hypothetical protein [Euryarchaeota archaeon]
MYPPETTANLSLHDEALKGNLIPWNLMKNPSYAQEVYEIWNKNLIPAYPEISKRRNNLVLIFIGANSPEELELRYRSYHDALNKFCEKFGYNIEDVIFYSEWTRMRDGEVNRERDPDVAYVVFIDGHAQLPYHDPVEISEGYQDNGYRPASERLSYLKELDRDILLVIGPICFSEQVADVFLDGGVKSFFPQDVFEIDNGAVEFDHRMSSLVMSLAI